VADWRELCQTKREIHRFQNTLPASGPGSEFHQKVISLRKRVGVLVPPRLKHLFNFESVLLWKPMLPMNHQHQPNKATKERRSLADLDPEEKKLIELLEWSQGPGVYPAGGEPSPETGTRVRSYSTIRNTDSNSVCETSHEARALSILRIAYRMQDSSLCSRSLRRRPLIQSPLT
jgi:hypothetical protein